jgi:hypothetical protein
VMKVVHKVLVDSDVDSPQKVQMPPLARILNAQCPERPSLVTIWYETCDPNETSWRFFQFFMTGSPIPDKAEYVATFLFGGGLFVLHLYEVTDA